MRTSNDGDGRLPDALAERVAGRISDATVSDVHAVYGGQSTKNLLRGSSLWREIEDELREYGLLADV